MIRADFSHMCCSLQRSTSRVSFSLIGLNSELPCQQPCMRCRQSTISRSADNSSQQQPDKDHKRAVQGRYRELRRSGLSLDQAMFMLAIEERARRSSKGLALQHAEKPGDVMDSALDLLNATDAALQAGTEVVLQVTRCLHTVDERMHAYGRHVVTVSTLTALSIVALMFKTMVMPCLHVGWATHALLEIALWLPCTVMLMRCVQFAWRTRKWRVKLPTDNLKFDQQLRVRPPL